MSQRSARERLASKPVHSTESECEQDFVSYTLAIHSLLLTASYVIIVANITKAIQMTWFGIAILGFHYTLSEVMLRGIKKKSYWYTVPWFLIVLIEEIVLFGLGVSHVTAAYKLYGYSYRLLFQYKGGFMVLAPFLTGIRVFLGLKIGHSCYRFQYDKL